jgi:hypothetical protein
VDGRTGQKKVGFFLKKVENPEKGRTILFSVARSFHSHWFGYFVYFFYYLNFEVR